MNTLKRSPVYVTAGLSEDGKHILKQWIERMRDGKERVLRVDVLPAAKRQGHPRAHSL